MHLAKLYYLNYRDKQPILIETDYYHYPIAQRPTCRGTAATMVNSNGEVHREYEKEMVSVVLMFQ